MTTNGAYRDEMNEVALFADALRAAVPTQPDPGLGRSLVPRLAEAARTSTLEAETQPRSPVRPTRRRPLSRRRLVARVAIAVAVIPLAFAGLAVAGVTLPSPARDAFDRVGITLPNQPSDPSQKPTTTPSEQAPPEASGSDAPGTAQPKATGDGGNSTAAHEHAREQREKARGKAKGHERGKAVGLNEGTPPGQAKTPPGQAKTPPGQARTPPGKAKTPPGKAKTPPGQAKTPPGHTKTPPGKAKGHAKVPPGQAKK